MKRYLTIILVIVALIGNQAVTRAQDNQNKNIHITIDESGKVIKDTSFTVQSDMSAAEIDKLIQSVTGNHLQPINDHFYPKEFHDSILFGSQEIPIDKMDSILSEHFMDIQDFKPFHDYMFKFSQDSASRDLIPEMQNRSKDSCLYMKLDDPNAHSVAKCRSEKGKQIIIHKPVQGETDLIKELKKTENETPQSQSTTRIIIQENKNTGNKKEVVKKEIIYVGSANASEQDKRHPATSDKSINKT